LHACEPLEAVLAALKLVGLKTVEMIGTSQDGTMAFWVGKACGVMPVYIVRNTDPALPSCDIVHAHFCQMHMPQIITICQDTAVPPGREVNSPVPSIC